MLSCLEQSPYLRRHSADAVDWYAWNREGLKHARAREKPIFLVIGAAGCSASARLQRETLQRPEVAELLNSEFSCLLVDRDERPDLHEVYASAAAALGKASEATPLLCLLTPDRVPFLCSVDGGLGVRDARPDLFALLRRVSELWASERQSLLNQASEVLGQVKVRLGVERPRAVGVAALQLASAWLLKKVSQNPGAGWSAAGLTLLLRQYRQQPSVLLGRLLENELSALSMSSRYDAVGGGFFVSPAGSASFSEGEALEKRLSDNAQLAALYLHAYQVLRQPLQRRVVTETLDFIVRDLQGELPACALGIAATEIVPGQRRDERVIVAPNALAIEVLSEASRVLDEPRYLKSAQGAADFLLSQAVDANGQLLHAASASGVAVTAETVRGFLEDYAALGNGLLSLYETTGQLEQLKSALRLTELLVNTFGNSKTGAFQRTSRAHSAAPVRAEAGHDGDLPSGNALAARLLTRLSYHLGRSELRALAVKALRAHGRGIERTPGAFATALLVVDLLLEPPLEVVLLGSPGEPLHDELAAEIARHYLPNKVEARHDPGVDNSPGSLPLTRDKQLLGAATAYVCRDFKSDTPLTTSTALAAALTAAELANREARGVELEGVVLSGAATPAATLALQHRPEKNVQFRRLGRTDLNVSALGYGGFALDYFKREHEPVLMQALRAGINVIDTASNYSAGRSQRLIGEVLETLVQGAELSRAEIVLVSKLGHVDVETAAALERHPLVAPTLHRLQSGEGFCLHPLWLEAELTRSLARLNLDCLDVALLYNPEQLFVTAASDAEFYAQLGQAFAFLETEVARGRIGWYGVSSNQLAVSSGHAATARVLDLERLWQLACSHAGETHHFGVIEVPLNLLEAEVLLAAGEPSLLERATRLGLGVLTNRPLNAVAGSLPLQLAQQPSDEPSQTLESSCDALHEAEQEFRHTFAPYLLAAEGIDPERIFAWADWLTDLAPRLETRDQWLQIEHAVVRPQTLSSLSAVDRVLDRSLAQAWDAWKERYGARLQALLAQLAALAAKRHLQRLAALDELVGPLLPEGSHGEPFAQKALWAALSVVGPSSVLLGAHSQEHLAAGLSVLRRPPLATAAGIFAATAFRAQGES